MGLFDRFSKHFAKSTAGYDDPETGERHVTPWKWKVKVSVDGVHEDELYIGWNGQVWVYRSMPLLPLQHASTSEMMREASKVERMFEALASHTPRIPIPVERNREWHIVSSTSYGLVEIPRENENYPELVAYQLPIFDELITPKRLVAFGVRLIPRIGGSDAEQEEKKSFLDRSRGFAKAATVLMGDDLPEIDNYMADLVAIVSMFNNVGATPLTKEQTGMLEGWYANGRSPELLMYDHPKYIEIVDTRPRRVEMSALVSANREVLNAPLDRWVLDVQQHPTDPIVVSIRGEVQEGARARMRARAAQRFARSQAEEEAQTGDLSWEETYRRGDLGALVERELVATNAPLLTNVSVVFGRIVYNDPNLHYVFSDHLQDTYDMTVSPLIGRQIAALDETLPTSSKRVNPHLQDFNTRMISHAGLTSFPQVGDDYGVFLGLDATVHTPVFLDPGGAPKANQPATMAVFGDSGAGKTWCLQHIAVQCAAMGLPVTFINPKGNDSLRPLVDAVGGVRIRLRDIRHNAGALDPFATMTDKDLAKDVVVHFIETVFNLNDIQKTHLETGLHQAATANVRTLDQALDFVQGDPGLVQLIRQKAAGNPMFALVLRPRTETREDLLGVDDRRLTLIEFAEELQLPEGPPPYSDSERLSLAVMRLLISNMMQRMLQNKQGVLIVDEAWAFLNSPQGRAELERLARLGRSLNILPILATQKVADLLQYDMESYLSRVLAMQLSDKREAEAALRLAGFEPTDSRIQALAQFGPRKLPTGRSRPSMALFSDFRDRRTQIAIGPTSERWMEVFTTNPEEKQRLEAQRNR